MNESGNSNNLEPQHFGNTSAVRHGAFSRRTLAPRASEIADELLEAGHTVGLDRLAAEEIGSLVAMAESMDDDLLSRGLTDRHGKARSLVELRIRISGRLQRWLRGDPAVEASVAVGSGPSGLARTAGTPDRERVPVDRRIP